MEWCRLAVISLLLVLPSDLTGDKLWSFVLTVVCICPEVTSGNFVDPICIDEGRNKIDCTTPGVPIFENNLDEGEGEITDAGGFCIDEEDCLDEDEDTDSVDNTSHDVGDSDDSGVEVAGIRDSTGVLETSW